MRSAAVVLMVLSFAGCGTRAGRPQSSRAAEFETPMRVWITLTSSRPTIQIRAPEALRIWSHEGGRYEIVGDAGREAETLILGEAAGVAQLGGMWSFLMRDGTMLRSATFLGTPSAIGGGMSPPFDVVSSPASARMAVVSGRRPGALWTSIGGGFEPMQSAGDRVLGAAFVDADHGVVRAVGGALGLTTDGGRTFQIVDLPGPARSVAVERERFVVEVGPAARSAMVSHGADLHLGRRYLVDRTGSLELSDWALAEELTVAHRSMSSRWTRRMEAWVRSVDVPPSLVGGPELRSLRPDVPRDLASCDFVTPWRAGWLALCGTPARLRFSSGPGAPPTVVPGVELRERVLTHAIVLDADGVHLGISGACAGMRELGARKQDDDAVIEVHAPRPACIIDVRDGSTREIAMQRGEWLRILRGGRALTVGSGWPVPVHVYDAEGAPLPLGIEAEVSHISFRRELISIVDRRGVLWVGRLGALERRDVPAGVVAFSFGDAQHGMAVGNTLAEIYVTRDGARSFERIPIDAPRRELAPHGLSRVTCMGERCEAWLPRVGARIETLGFGPPESLPRAISGGSIQPPGAGASSPQHEPWLRCEASAPPGDADLAIDSEASELHAVLGNVELTARRDGTIRWTGGGRTRAGPLPWGTSLTVGLARSDLAIVAICADTCAIVRARRGERPDVLATDLPPGGGLLVRESAAEILVAIPWSDADAVHALWLDRDGEPLARRTLSADPVIDEIDGAPSLIERHDRSFALGRVAELAPREVETWSVEDTCSDAASGPERHALMIGGPALWLAQPWRAVLRRSDDRTCLARLELTGSSPGVLAPDPAGGMSGVVRRRGVEITLRCVLER